MSGPTHRVLRNARLGGEPVDILIQDGEIVEIGHAVDCTAEEVHLDGRTVIPGLWDEHTHFSQWALRSRRADVSGAASAREAARIVSNALASATPLPLDERGRPLPFVGNGFRDALWSDAPNLADLDDAGAGAPIVLISADLHSVWLNTSALELFGHSGHETGLLREEPAFEVQRRVNSVPDAVLDEWVDAAAREAAARGVVGIVDFEMTWNLEPWSRRMAGGFDALRVDFGIYTQDLDRAIDLGLRSGRRIGELLTVGSYKVITDGSLGTRTAYCFDEYPGLEGLPGARGLLTVAPSELEPLLRRASDAGITPAVHAIGDHANALVLDVFEAVGVTGRIEHAQLLTPGDVERFGRLGIVASVQPEHAMDDRDIADRYWVGRTDRAFLLRSLLDAGARLLLGSDAPVAPLDPWVTMAAAVGRARDGREPWHPEQSLTVAQALDASVRSSVAPGQPADLVVLDVDPFGVSAEELRRMPVAGTLLGGRWTHRAF
ncbi:hypothetical protein FB562_0809 [Homoserinimonas aerilata]|uniref:Amidohydrolase 3 domain-containing protein n=1 Tax=Homoserinimonas aerilata TaxID=1162970 RepID=A0A542YIB2_9MICO|nr:amidohydrolase [Homoserinimonas aerilata]TQL47741.1 hypothetical protein FB562_0809 [Homoserinimonas aerilata]